MSEDTTRLINDAVVLMSGGGVSETGARQQCRLLMDAALAESDHAAYRTLADAVTKQIGMLSGDADSWDGESDELTILLSWLELSGEWLLELYTHLAAHRMRTTRSDGDSRDRSGPIREALRTVHANLIDPWTEDPSAGNWGRLIRKSDGTPVPWQFSAAALRQITGGS